jgi:serine/threonine protein phosphatase PrpC/CRP-like cAMP-binding protein
MQLAFAAATDVGRQRNHNEDNFLIDKKLQLFIVADGMGGHAAGEVASSITVHELRDAVHANGDLLERFQSGDPDFQSVEILQMLEHAAQAACGAVYDRAQAEVEKRGMGTTLSVLLIVSGPETLRGFIAHVGDSRIYLTRQGQTHQLTEDHSLMNELVKRGKIKPGEIDSSPYKQFKNAVTRAVGVYASVEVDTFDFDILPGDQFLLCTDGMYVYLDEAKLPEFLAEGNIKDVPKRLVDQANNGGGHDNITTIVIRVPGDTVAALERRAAELSLKIEVLKSMPMFRYLSYKELVRVMNITQTVDFADDDSVFREGEPGETMYVVLDGSVRLHKGDMIIAELGRGQHFGEMALVDRSLRSLDGTAVGVTRLLSIRRKEFYEIIKKEPSLSVKLLWSFVQVLTERLRTTTLQLEDARQQEASLAVTQPQPAVVARVAEASLGPIPARIFDDESG